jgi:LexA DNA binding domain
MADVDVQLDLEELSRELAGLVVGELTQPTSDAIALHFTNGEVLSIRPRGDGFAAILTKPRRHMSGHDGRPRPTLRQAEYMDFISKYMDVHGVSPAEADIQRHFRVSAPSVNQMIRTLERRGFIERGRDRSGQTAARSIRVVWDD